MDKAKIEDKIKDFDIQISIIANRIAVEKQMLNRLKRWRRAAKSKLKEGSND